MTTQQTSAPQRSWLFCVALVIALIALIQPYHSVLSATTTTDCSSSSCSVRTWLSDLQKEVATLQNTASKLQKAINVINSTNTNTTTQILLTRTSQLKKVNLAIDSLNLEIQVVSDRCNNFDGPDCNITRALNITGEFMYFSFDSGSVVDKYGIPVLTNNMQFSDASPRKPYYGKYAVFDKIRQASFETVSSTWVTFGTGKSMSMWLRKLPNPDYSVIWNFITSQPSKPLLQHTGTNSGDKIDFFYDTGGHINSNAKMLDNEWHHLAIVCKSTGVDIYIDGVLDRSTATTFTHTDNIRFGFIHTATSASFNGHIDELRMFNVELTPAQIQQIYNY